MARITIQLAASIGDICYGCDRPLARGEQINGVKWDNGEGAGWYCDACIAYWQAHGRPPHTQEESLHG